GGALPAACAEAGGAGLRAAPRASPAAAGGAETLHAGREPVQAGARQAESRTAEDALAAARAGEPSSAAAGSAGVAEDTPADKRPALHPATTRVGAGRGVGRRNPSPQSGNVTVLAVSSSAGR